jgi:hypothetical protein
MSATQILSLTDYIEKSVVVRGDQAIGSGNINDQTFTFVASIFPRFIEGWMHFQCDSDF